MSCNASPNLDNNDSTFGSVHTCAALSADSPNGKREPREYACGMTYSFNNFSNDSDESRIRGYTR